MPVLIASRPSAKINGQPNAFIDSVLIGMEVNEQADGLSTLRIIPIRDQGEPNQGSL